MVNPGLVWIGNVLTSGDVPSIFGVTIGGIAFAISGCRGALKMNAPLWLALLNGLSLYCFGGGLLRDGLLFEVLPWFLEERLQLVVVTIILIFYIHIHEHLVSKERIAAVFRDDENKSIWILALLAFAQILLVCCDIIGLVEFSIAGHRVAESLLQRITIGDAVPTKFLLALGEPLSVFISAFFSQLGGGIFAALFLWLHNPRISFLKKIRANLKYYGVAMLINIVCYWCSSNYVNHYSLAVLLPFLLAGLLIDGDTKEIFTSLMNSRFSNEEREQFTEEVAKRNLVYGHLKSLILLIDFFIVFRILYTVVFIHGDVNNWIL
jgi:uncharacterized membrane protein YeiH